MFQVHENEISMRR